MRLKLTHNQFKTLYALLTGVMLLKGLHPLTDEGLQQVVLQALRLRFYHMDGIVRKQYKIKLTIPEMQAFWLWFKEHEYPDTSHEGYMLNDICSVIYTHFDTKPHIYQNETKTLAI